MGALDGRHQWAVSRRVRAALLVNGLRWRGRSSLAMFAVAVFACGAAAFGPIYLHSGDQLALTRTLDGAPPGNAGLTIGNASFPVAGHHTRAWVKNYAEHPPEPGTGTRWWAPPIMTESAGFRTVPLVPKVPGAEASSTVRASDPAGTAPPIRLDRFPFNGTRPYSGTLIARSDDCAHLHMVAGVCPEGRNQGVAISTRTDQTLGLALGGTLEVLFGRTTRPVEMRIVGIYVAGTATAPYWWGESYFGFDSVGLTDLLSIDAAFTTPTGVRALAPHRKIYVMAQDAYRKGTLTTGSVAAMRNDVNAFKTHSLTDERIRVSTTLLGLLARSGSVEHTEATVVDVADLELVLLGILVLYFVASRTAAEREPDVRLGELRGFRSRSTIGVALAEPVAIVTAAAPAGLLGAWLVAEATAPSIFGAGVGVSVTLLSIAAAIAAGVVGVAAAGLGARRSLVGGLSAAADAPGEIGPSKWYVLGDAGVVALAAAAFFALVVGGDSGNGVAGSNPLAAFAPGLLAVALGILAARLLPRVLGATHRRSAFSTRLPVALAARTVSRRREYRTQLVLTALAVALATFAVSGWAIAARNRDQRAELGVGASRVLTVSVRPGVTFLRAVRSADHGRHDAMAVVLEHATDGTTLAVDARQLGSDAIWPADLGVKASAVAHRLHPAGLAPPVSVSGTSLAAEVGLSGTIQPAPQLTAEVYDVNTQFASTVTLGNLTPGLHRYAASLGTDCPGSCRLLGLSLTWSSTSPIAGTRSPTITVAVHSLTEHTATRGWQPLQAGLADAHRWDASGGGAKLVAGNGALAARISFISGNPVTLGPRDVPAAVPVVVTPTSASIASGDGGPLVVGLDGSTLSGHAVGEVPALPGTSGDSVLATLGTLESYLDGSMLTDTTEVWLSPTAPASILGALRADGVAPVSTASTAAAVAALSHNGLTLAYLLYLVAAVAAAVLVMGATAFTLSSAARRRQDEFSALRAVGVHARALRRTVQIEQAVVLGTGVVVGVVAGAVAAAVALRSVPEFVTRSPGPPLQLGLPAVDLVITVGAVLVALVVTVAVGSSIVVGGAAAERLAGGQS